MNLQQKKELWTSEMKENLAKIESIENENVSLKKKLHKFYFRDVFNINQRINIASHMNILNENRIKNLYHNLVLRHFEYEFDGFQGDNERLINSLERQKNKPLILTREPTKKECDMRYDAVEGSIEHKKIKAKFERYYKQRECESIIK